MKPIIVTISIAAIFSSCNTNKKGIVDVHFIDSLISNYQQPTEYRQNTAELVFWKNRIDPNNPGIVNEMKYASALAGKFHLYGNIRDMQTADNILLNIDTLFKQKEAAPNLSLVSHYITQHRFHDAYNYFQKAKAIGIKKYESYTTSFDINFELGNYTNAYMDLQAIKAENDYGYQFRLAKWEHYKGNMDGAIQAMLKAAALSGTNITLEQAALSNLADLYLHNSELNKANAYYMQSVKLSAVDLHSLMGIGWLSLVHDGNDTLAEKIFRFVQTKTQSPDPLLKMIQIAEARKDIVSAKKYADQFITKVNDSLYGNMYHKYLIDIYTSTLNDPAKAEQIAVDELKNRNTPQTNAWYAYALLMNNKKVEAYKIYEQSISGKPLEGLELYWMGKLMSGLGKKYNANEFYKEAYKNRYDLGINKIKDIEKALNQ
ncbi:hypothetical protein LK994_12280 [Ferruginibacter lapsinanis]|uniref:tetratricopeptide repeat protein n=1 Tax=Ferruginibacter lapsinanis TaxID=563172 RepID=UPI001E4B4804|nr:hypothetical protein [Ferruginibacter lapsinanis]UEG49410.1 hypothetical protein LK994_12280 [Ferruginibacter lapsinanis]